MSTTESDLRQGKLQNVTEVLPRVLKGVEKQKAFIDDFRCPDPTGRDVPCVTSGDELVPYLRGPLALAPCPVAAGTGCPQHRAHLEAKRRVAQERWERRAAELGIPEVLWGASIDDPDPKEPLRVVKAWLIGGFTRRRALGLFGENGVGKSWGAAAAVREHNGWFVYARDLQDQLLSPRLSDDALDRAIHTPLLIIDNLGAEYLKPDGALVSKLDSITWHREGNRRPMIVTSRLPWTTVTPEERRRGMTERSPETLRARCTLDMIDRLETWMEMHHFRGESLRRTRRST